MHRVNSLRALYEQCWRAKRIALVFVHMAFRLGMGYETLLIELIFHHRKYLK